jgi:hypothetical protein
LSAAAHLLGGEVGAGQIICPGPGHSPRDRSLVVSFDPSAPDGFVVHSFAGDDFRSCKDHVRRRLGLPNGEFRAIKPAAPPARRWPTESNTDTARWLWGQRMPIAGTIAESYLRKERRYGGLIQPTLGFLPANKKYPAALIAAYGIVTEREPGLIAIADHAVLGVHLIKLKPDGSDRFRDDPKCKITVGKSFVAPIVAAPPNDLLGMVLAEGVEDAVNAHEASGLGAWAAGSATRLPALACLIPSYIESVTILVDDDDAGRINAHKLMCRLRDRDIEVRLTSRGNVS